MRKEKTNGEGGGPKINLQGLMLQARAFTVFTCCLLPRATKEAVEAALMEADTVDPRFSRVVMHIVKDVRQQIDELKAEEKKNIILPGEDS